MPAGDNPWPFVIRPEPYEALPDWLRRLSRAYEYPSLRMFINSAGFPFVHRSELFLRPPRGLLHFLSRKTQIQIRDLIERTALFPRYPKPLYVIQHSAFGRRERVGIAWGRTNNEVNSSYLALRHKDVDIFRVHCIGRSKAALLESIAEACIKRCAGRTAVLPNIEQYLIDEELTLRFTKKLINEDISFGVVGDNKLYSSPYSVLKLSNSHENRRFASQYRRYLAGYHPGRKAVSNDDICRAFEMLTRGETVSSVANSLGVSVSAIHSNVVVHFLSGGASLPKAVLSRADNQMEVRKRPSDAIKLLKARIAP